MPTIAIIHHEKHILTAWRMAFEAEGFSVQAFATTGEAAHLVSNPPDLFILPRRSKPDSGATFFKHIREVSNVPVVFVCAQPDLLEAELEPLGLKASAIIEMPFLQREVVSQIRCLLS